MYIFDILNNSDLQILCTWIIILESRRDVFSTKYIGTFKKFIEGKRIELKLSGNIVEQPRAVVPGQAYLMVMRKSIHYCSRQANK
jgi:hypothetical protein